MGASYDTLGRHYAPIRRPDPRLAAAIVSALRDVDVQAEMWLIRDYAPETIAAHAASFPSIDWLLDTLPGASVSPLPIACDCTDGFMVAYWGRPEAYLDPAIRAGTSAWQQLPANVVDRALDRLRVDLRDGEWDRRYGGLRRRETLDVGLRLIRSELRDGLDLGGSV